MLLLLLLLLLLPLPCLSVGDDVVSLFPELAVDCFRLLPIFHFPRPTMVTMTNDVSMFLGYGEICLVDGELAS
jgi:hypothetical protein